MCRFLPSRECQNSTIRNFHAHKQKINPIPWHCPKNCYPPTEAWWAILTSSNSLAAMSQKHALMCVCRYVMDKLPAQMASIASKSLNLESASLKSCHRTSRWRKIACTRSTITITIPQTEWFHLKWHLHICWRTKLSGETIQYNLLLFVSSFTHVTYRKAATPLSGEHEPTCGWLPVASLEGNYSV